ARPCSCPTRPSSDLFESRIGLPGEEGSLSARVASLEGSLIEAASRPDSEARLLNVLDALTGVASKLNTLSRDVQASRLEADADRPEEHTSELQSREK